MARILGEDARGRTARARRLPRRWLRTTPTCGDGQGPPSRRGTSVGEHRVRGSLVRSGRPHRRHPRALELRSSRCSARSSSARRRRAACWWRERGHDDPTDATISSSWAARSCSSVTCSPPAPVPARRRATTSTTKARALWRRVAAERARASWLWRRSFRPRGPHAVRARPTSRRRVATRPESARGTLGKILLRARLVELADEHFAEDAMNAPSAGETTAELRACTQPRHRASTRSPRRGARAPRARPPTASRSDEERLRLTPCRTSGPRSRTASIDSRRGPPVLERTVASRRRAVAVCHRAHDRGTRGPPASVSAFLPTTRSTPSPFGRKPSGHASPRCAAPSSGSARRSRRQAQHRARAPRDRRRPLDAHLRAITIAWSLRYIVRARVALEDGDSACVAQALTTVDRSRRAVAPGAEVAIVRAMHRRALSSRHRERERGASGRAFSGDEHLTEIHIPR